MGLPSWLSGKESACNVGDRLDPWVRKISWRRKRQSPPGGILAWEISWTEESGGLLSVHWVAKESDMTQD